MQEIIQGYQAIDKSLNFLTTYPSPLKRAFKVSKIHFSGKNDKVSDNALTREEFRIFLYYLSFYYNMFALYRNDKRPKVDTLVQETHLPVYRKYVATKGITYNDTEELWEQIDVEQKGKIEFDEFVHKCIVLSVS